MRALMFALAAASMTSFAFAQTPPPAPLPADVARNVERLREAALSSDLAYDTVEDLVTQIGPRLAGSEAEARARDWAAAMLRRQRFSNIRIEPVNIPFWDATREEAQIVLPSSQRLVIAALGGSASTPPEGLEAEIVRFPNIAALAAAPDSAVRGRIVFIDEMMIRTMDGSGYGVAVAKRGRCAPTAQPKGAVACLIRSVGTDSNRFAHQGGLSRQPDGAHLPAASLSPADANTLAHLLEQGPVRVRLNIDTVTREEAPSGNVIAEIPGREHPEEIVLLAAHLDSWDLGQGAIDDGAGVAIVTAAARLIGDLPRRPRRTVRILLAGSEEIGGLGGDAYGAAHAGERHIVAAESDFGAGRVWRFRTKFGPEAQPYALAMAAALAPLGVNASADPAMGGADIAALIAAGAPVADLIQDGSLYFDNHHTANDTLDKIDPEALRQNVAAYAVFAYLAADSDWVFAAP